LSEEDDESELMGQVLADTYRIDSLLGRGGMGTVWKATDLKRNKPVAVKLIRPQFASQEEAQRRFEIEAHAAARVASAHAVRIFDYGTALGRPYIAMEYLEGESLSDMVARAGPVPLGELARIVEQATDALEKAHALGIIHRDLKPDNVFLATNVKGEDNRFPYIVKVVDFGIAKMLDGAHGSLSGPTQTGMVIGTPTFMSPEQLTEGGVPDVLMDVWAMGVTVFAAATGRLPFDGDVMGDLVIKVCSMPMPVPSSFNRNVTTEFDQWFARACSRRRDQRFSTMRELSDSLSAFADPEVRESTALRLQRRSDVPSIMPEEAGTPLSPRTAVALGIILGVSLLLALAGVLAWRDKVEQEKNVPSSP
jgi:eukaryotic-like serine/threonine-protein kinase